MATLVNKIVEGLRGDAFLVARDLGHEALMQPKGLETLISRIRRKKLVNFSVLAKSRAEF